MSPSENFIKDMFECVQIVDPTVEKGKTWEDIPEDDKKEAMKFADAMISRGWKRES